MDDFEEADPDTSLRKPKNNPNAIRMGLPVSTTESLEKLSSNQNAREKDFIRAFDLTKNEFLDLQYEIFGILRRQTGRSRASFCGNGATPLLRTHHGRRVTVCEADNTDLMYWQLNLGRPLLTRPIVEGIVMDIRDLVPELQ
jgi:hypothetical protein